MGDFNGKLGLGRPVLSAGATLRAFTSDGEVCNRRGFGPGDKLRPPE